MKNFITNTICLLATLIALIQAITVDHPKYKPCTFGRAIAGRYIVEFDDTFSGTSRQFLSDFEQGMQRQRPSFKSQQLRCNITQEYTSNVFRGVSLRLSANQQQQLNVSSAQSSETEWLKYMLEQHYVKRVFPVVEVPRPEAVYATRAAFPGIFGRIDDLPFSHGMTQVNRVHRELGLYGKGVVVGIIDSGVDYNHPALGGGFGKGYKIQFGEDLVGDNYNVNDPDSIQPKLTPLDTCKGANGHGTHVAGIIGAEDKKYNFTGVAPQATLGMWRVFGCTGSSTNDLIIKALILAYEAGCNVINLSLGETNNWSNDPTALVTNRLVEKGVSVIAAAGNDGREGAFILSSPSTAVRAVSVASVDNAYGLEPMMLLENGELYPFLASKEHPIMPNGTVVSYDNSSTETSLACKGSHPSSDIRGKIALVRRGSCTFDEKATTAAQFGAIAILVYDPDQEKEAFQPGLKTGPIPAAGISLTAGNKLASLSPVGVVFNKELSTVPLSTAGRISVFSSVGPTFEFNLKPDIAGVGGMIFSTLPLSLGGYGTLSGTSMATPYITGCFALYLQAHPNTDPATIAEQFKNYAAPAPYNDTFDNPFRQGAGLVQAFDAIEQTMRVSPSHVSFNDTNHRKAQEITLMNNGNRSVTYELDSVRAVTLSAFNGTQDSVSVRSPVGFADPMGRVLSSASKITVNPGEKVVFTLDMADSVDPKSLYPLYGGYVRLNPTSGSEKTIHIPYGGVMGDVSKLDIFAPHFPFLALPKDVGSGMSNTTSFHISPPSNSSDPWLAILIRMNMGTERLETDIVTDNGDVIGYLDSYSYLPRNTDDEDDYMFVDYWDGTILKRENFVDRTMVNSGTYRMRFRALKLLADPDLPESWETTTSVPIVVSN
ncbi:peptidase S8/S53 domain-containing protein [Radiomyces spectabilis]|uniref:peptidase S8/S53 domain-containing protein n=1 Tax=Radiomyces spectabilis TaxID=64574 RepID=UPI00221FAEBB|nr:peptidase S8/S53 domain-containing protein [Radiomyces spectabilis]KAI8377474.1 peptidase S8/S53 domain-containing protein [Radiomyces spectabilis]